MNSEKQPVEFVIISCSYNNEYWCSGHLNSIAEQTYPHWHLLYIDDASTDSTNELVHLFTDREEFKGKCTIIRNTKREGSLKNFYTHVHRTAPHKVIVCLDADDYFADPHALEIVAQAYSDPTVWLTYGSYRLNTVTENIRLNHYTDDIVKMRAFRHPNLAFLANHLKTFYAKLFQQIKKEDLLYEKNFFPVLGDMAFMYPMLEMASEGHIRFIRETIYIYNVTNVLNDRRVSEPLCARLGDHIRAKPPYEPLKSLF